MDRAALEERAKACCPTENWYELMDVIDETPDSDLWLLIEKHEDEGISDIKLALNMVLKFLLFIVFILGAFFTFALLWSAPIFFGVITGDGTAVATPPDVSTIWDKELIPLYIICVSCFIFLGSYLVVKPSRKTKE